jgi:hypothetical protein
MEETNEVHPKRGRKRLYVAGGMAAIVAIALAVTPKPAVQPDATVDKLEADFHQSEAVALYNVISSANHNSRLVP